MLPLLHIKEISFLHETSTNTNKIYADLPSRSKQCRPQVTKSFKDDDNLDQGKIKSDKNLGRQDTKVDENPIFSQMCISTQMSSFVRKKKL